MPKMHYPGKTREILLLGEHDWNVSHTEEEKV